MDQWKEKISQEKEKRKKEAQKCKEVLKSVCGKAGCQVAGMKPMIIEVISKKIKMHKIASR